MNRKLEKYYADLQAADGTALIGYCRSGSALKS